MASKEKKAPIKETVGALRYCFNVPDANNGYTSNYEDEIITTKIAKSVKVTENGDTVPVYASGEVYDDVTDVTSIENEVEAVAFPADDLAKMRGDTVTTAGLIIKGGSNDRPYFAFGKTVKMRGGKERFVWYPKCKLLSNTDDINTKEDSFSEQNDTVIIKAYPFNETGGCSIEMDTSVKTVDGVTEDKFFSKVITGDADLTKVKTLKVD